MPSARYLNQKWVWIKNFSTMISPWLGEVNGQNESEDCWWKIQILKVYCRWVFDWISIDNWGCNVLPERGRLLMMMICGTLSVLPPLHLFGNKELAAAADDDDDDL
jgi:hypothetical protein